MFDHPGQVVMGVIYGLFGFGCCLAVIVEILYRYDKRLTKRIKREQRQAQLEAGRR